MIERRAAILKYIQAQGEVNTEQLFGRFPEHNPKTLRRDLVHWEQAGAILRSHGKARINNQYLFVPEEQPAKREGESSRVKNELAVAALSFLGGHNSIFIDAGSTMMAFARQLPDKNFTVLTGAPNIALNVVSGCPQCSVLLAGGSLNSKTQSCVGYSSTEFVKQINIDIAFMGAAGFSVSGGFTVGEHFESDLKRVVIERAGKVVLLMESSKIGVSMPFTFARASEVDVLICDKYIDPEAESHILSKGTKLVKV